MNIDRFIIRRRNNRFVIVEVDHDKNQTCVACTPGTKYFYSGVGDSSIRKCAYDEYAVTYPTIKRLLHENMDYGYEFVRMREYDDN